MKFIGWLLGLDETTSIEAIELSLAAPWALDGIFWVFVGVLAAFAGAIIFYRKYQRRGSSMARTALGIGRGLLLALLLVTLAAPVLRITARQVQQPTVYLVFDGTDSMAIRDELPTNERLQLDRATGLDVPAKRNADDASGERATGEPVSRMQYLQALLRLPDNLVDRLQAEQVCRLEAFVFDGTSTSQLRKLTAAARGGTLTGQALAEQLTSTGQVTALGAALEGVRDQLGTESLAAVVLFSDFAQNAGPPPTGGDQSPARATGAPIYTVGVGAAEALDLAVELLTDPKMKRAERTTLLVKLRQSGLQGQSVTVRLLARPLTRSSSETGVRQRVVERSEPPQNSGLTADFVRPQPPAAGFETAAGDAVTLIGRRDVTLTSTAESVEFPYTPDAAGMFEFEAEVDALEGEVIEENNRASRQLNIIDDYLRLMFVAFEPTWEWRFVKEVFHRDRLVGTNGFRTYLSSSDPRVRQSNVLFLPTLTPQRSEFFANDVIFLGDMPQSSLTPRFCGMVKEFVGSMGGGLVVIAGPRFGPGELAATSLGELLPVVVDPGARLRDEREFRLQLAPHAALYPFMQLGENETQNRAAWDNLGPLPWYQPVAALHEQAFALAEHPSDRCVDGQTPQPLIAIRRYGKGEVVYLGFNELWRLRRKYGERYYRQFWSQLIYRLGMSHALGADKRFVVAVDRSEYRVEDRVTLTVEAYDENYEPLSEDDLPDRTLSAELNLPGLGPQASETRRLAVPFLRRGVFEARIPVYSEGQYSLRVQDPITGTYQQRRFEVTDSSAERRVPVRNVQLQVELARETGGRSYDLTTVDKLTSDLRLEPLVHRTVSNHALWSTPLWFILVVGLMLGEWLCRRMVNLN